MNQLTYNIYILIYAFMYTNMHVLLKAYSCSIFITHPLLISIFACINKQTNKLSASFACEADESNGMKHHIQVEFAQSAQREEETVREKQGDHLSVRPIFLVILTLLFGITLSALLQFFDGKGRKKKKQPWKINGFDCGTDVWVLKPTIDRFKVIRWISFNSSARLLYQR